MFNYHVIECPLLIPSVKSSIFGLKANSLVVVAKAETLK